MISSFAISGNTNGPNPELQSMKTLVGEGLQSRRVTCVDLGCNVVVTVIGLAMIIFAVVVFTTTVQKFGWVTSKVPLLCTMGGVGIIGTVVTILSIKWIVESYQKWTKFRIDVSEVT